MIWVKIEDGIPAAYESVIICYPFEIDFKGNTGLSVVQGYITKDGVWVDETWDEDNDPMELKVTHWHPLPKPPAI